MTHGGVARDTSCMLHMQAIPYKYGQALLLALSQAYCCMPSLLTTGLLTSLPVA